MPTPKMNEWVRDLGFTNTAFTAYAGAAAASAPTAAPVAAAPPGSQPSGRAAAPVAAKPARQSGSVFAGDDDEPTTPMALPGGPQPPAKPKPKKAVIDFGPDEGSDIEAQGPVSDEQLKRVTGQILDVAKINALGMGAAIAGACSDFKSYADEKLEALKKQEELDKLALEFGKIIAVAVTGGLAAGGEGLAAEITKVGIDLVAHGATEAAKSGVDGGSKGFAKMVDQLIRSATDWGTTFQNKAVKIIEAKVSALETAVRHPANRDMVLRRREHAMFFPFLSAPSSQFDALVEHWMGIPSRKRANALRFSIEERLISSFMTKYLIAVNPSEAMAWSINDMNGVYAERAAKKEVEERRKKLQLDS